MRYYGFATIDYLILENLHFHKDLSVLEIGVGTGSTARLIIGKVKEFWGVDISNENIDQLTSVYKNDKTVKFYTVDVCKDSYVGKKFNIVFSADTLEHVKESKGFFGFIAKHLSPDGVALVTFPNESEKRHHGITWFNRIEELLTLIDSSGLEIIDFYQVKKTYYHRFIEKLFWKIPKSILSKRKDVLPQSFENTKAFEIIKSGGIKAQILAIYANLVTKFAACFPLYRLNEIENNIENKVLLMHLKLKLTKA